MASERIRSETKEIKWKREDENQIGTLAERKKLSLP